MYDGQYILNHEFKKLFPYVDNMCYFVKCANKKAYLNPCGPATRNDKHGDGFCSHLDLEVSKVGGKVGIGGMGEVGEVLIRY